MKKELRDQVAHVAVATACLMPLAIQPGLLTGIIAGLGCGLIREVTEEGAPVTAAKIMRAFRSYLDLSFWTAAGAVAGIVGNATR